MHNLEKSHLSGGFFSCKKIFLWYNGKKDNKVVNFVFTKEDILKQLEVFKAAKGKTVILHSSYKAVGEVEGGPEAFLSTLIEYFTKDDGLFTVPTHTWDSEVYDKRKAESCLGLIPRLAAGRSDGIRNDNPSHSLKVFGREEKVKEFIKDEKTVESPTDPKGCYGKLYTEGGYVLLMGVGHDKNTFIHTVEEMLSVPDRMTEEKVERTIIKENGEEEKRYVKWFYSTAAEDVSDYFWKFEPAFRYHGCIVDGFLGNAPAQLCDARKLKECVELIYQNYGGKDPLSTPDPSPPKAFCNP